MSSLLDRLRELDPFSAEAVAILIGERIRQIEVERWSPEHDDDHKQGLHGAPLARAAACYAMRAGLGQNDHRYGRGYPPSIWPWSVSWWKPHERGGVRDLRKSGALIVADIARRLRAAQTDSPTKDVGP